MDSGQEVPGGSGGDHARRRLEEMLAARMPQEPQDSHGEDAEAQDAEAEDSGEEGIPMSHDDEDEPGAGSVGDGTGNDQSEGHHDPETGPRDERGDEENGDEE